MLSETRERLSERKKGLILSIVAIAFLGIITLAVYESNKNSVSLSMDGEKFEVRTHANTVGSLLSEQEIEVSEHDYVSHALDAPIEDGLSVQWKKSKPIAIQIDGEKESIWTTEETVGKVLAAEGIELAEHDKVNPELQAKIAGNDKIEIEKAFEITVADRGEKETYWSTAVTVEDFLNKEKIKLGELDRLEGPQTDEIIKPDSTVQIVRVEKKTDVVEEDTNYAVETKNDDSMLKGQKKVVQEGKKGKIEREYAIVLEDGKEVSRKKKSEKVIQEPKKEIVAVGSKVVVASNSQANAQPTNVSVSRGNSTPSSGGKEFYASATAYTAHCNGCSGITATGINLRSNPNAKVIAVDPSVIPLGSKVWVEGYGYAVAGDTGGAIKGNRVDLHFPSKEAAYKFGRKQVKVKVIN